MTDLHTPHDGEHSHGPQGRLSPALLAELRDHVPFSVLAVAIGLIVAGTLCIVCAGLFGDKSLGLNVGHEHGVQGEPAFPLLFFHLFHPAHMLFSAAATSAMFYRYERKTFKAILIGLVGAVGVCGASDIVMPHLSLVLLGIETPWHICVWEHPDLVLPFAGIGVVIGVATARGKDRSTILSHSLHVLASTMASIFYMVGPLGTLAWINMLGKVFLFVVIAVMVPCCVSDIVFPLLMTKPNRKRFFAQPHEH